MKPTPIRAIVFDMDGTLLDTLPDLVACANEAFAQAGFPQRTLDEARMRMGRGGRWLIEQLVPHEATPEERQRTFERWRKRYIASDYALTEPFPDVVGTIRDLRARGMKTAVLSNKFDAGVQLLAQRHFAGLFDQVRGDAPPLPRKPNPTRLLQLLDNLGVQPESAAYVGDSLVVVTTARNAGVRAIGVAWGYDAAAPLPRSELDAYIQTPRELLDLI